MNRHAKAIVASSAMLLTLALGASTASADTAPTVPSTDPAAQVGHTTALLSGEVDANWAPGDGPTTWRIQYRPEGSPDWLQANEGTLEAPDPVKVETPVFLEAKAASETYEFRLLAENAAGSAESASPYPSFATLAAKVPALTIDPADPLGYTTATLKGTVNPEGGNVNPLGPETLWLWWELQYSPKGQGAWSTAAGQIVEGPGAEATSPFGVEGTAVELSPGSEYETRLLVYYLSSFGLTTELQGADFTTKAVAKPTVTIDPITDFDASTASFSGTVNPNAPGAAPQDPAFDASWSFSCEPACPGVSEGATVPAGDQAENVAGDATHLEPNTEYAVTLKATNGGGSSEASTSFQTPGTPPTIEPFEAGPVRHDGAGINGQVNPHNSQTTYWFEWGTSDCSANPCTALPASKDASAGDGPFNQYVFRELGGLSPQTTYHFRLVAENAFGTTEGPDRSFTTAAAPPACTNADALGASQLPDCRAWEMVSPPDKNGNDVMPASEKVHPAADGKAVSFASLGAFGDVEATSVDTHFIAERTTQPSTSGWTTHAITPKQDPLVPAAIVQGQSPDFVEFSSDLSRAAYRGWGPLTVEPNVADISKLYLASGLRDAGATSFQLLSPSAASIPFNPAFFSATFRMYIAGSSNDFTHVLFETPFNLTDDAADLNPFAGKLYENTNGVLRLAGRIPLDSTETECDDAGAPACKAAPSSQAGLGAQNAVYTPDLISNDGSRIYFQAPAGNFGKLYLRENSTRTVQINASERTGTPESPQSARLWTASADGTRAFYTSAERLVDGDNDDGTDVYMYDATADPGARLTRLSATTNNHSAEEVIGVSGDGRYVYFTASGNLINGESPAGPNGLYVWHDGTLSLAGGFASNPDASRSGLRVKWSLNGSEGRVTPDGRHILFMSTGDTFLKGRGGFDGYNHGSTCLADTSLGGPCRELYLYSADSGSLRCISCKRSGATATADALVQVHRNMGTSPRNSSRNKALSDNGRYAFFTTAERLVQTDINSVEDAYEYDTRLDKLHLLSSGESQSASYFIDATPDGSNAFFATREQLSGWDVDSSYDLYDARIGGGLAEPSPPPPSCQGDACQRPPLQLNDPTPSSATSTASAVSRMPRIRCPKGKRRIKSHGRARCVKRVKRGRAANHNRRTNR